jgi:hypothetical protein
MYSVHYSARQGSWYVQVDGVSDDFGTSLYDTEQDAYDELAQMVVEGLITQEEISYPEAQPLCGCGARHYVHTDADEEIS